MNDLDQIPPVEELDEDDEYTDSGWAPIVMLAIIVAGLFMAQWVSGYAPSEDTHPASLLPGLLYLYVGAVLAMGLYLAIAIITRNGRKLTDISVGVGPRLIALGAFSIRWLPISCYLRYDRPPNPATGVLAAAGIALIGAVALGPSSRDTIAGLAAVLTAMAADPLGNWFLDPIASMGVAGPLDAVASVLLIWGLFNLLPLPGMPMWQVIRSWFAPPDSYVGHVEMIVLFLSLLVMMVLPAHLFFELLRLWT